MKLTTFDEFTSMVNTLIEYFKEVKDLKEGGIDITKFAAHKSLYAIVCQDLYNKYGIGTATEILKYADNPQIGTIQDLYNYVRDYTIKEKSPKVEEKVVATDKKPCSTENNSKFIINGKKVSEQEYNKTIELADEVLNKLFKMLFEYNG